MPITSNQIDKVDVACVVVERAGSLTARARVNTIQAANQVLSTWAAQNQADEKDPCTIQIIFEDGFEYHGRLTIDRAKKKRSLARLVRQDLLNLLEPQSENQAACLVQPEGYWITSSQDSRLPINLLERYDI